MHLSARHTEHLDAARGVRDPKQASRACVCACGQCHNLSARHTEHLDAARGVRDPKQASRACVCACGQCHNLAPRHTEHLNAARGVRDLKQASRACVCACGQCLNLSARHTEHLDAARGVRDLKHAVRARGVQPAADTDDAHAVPPARERGEGHARAKIKSQRHFVCCYFGTICFQRSIKGAPENTARRNMDATPKIRIDEIALPPPTCECPPPPRKPRAASAVPHWQPGVPPHCARRLVLPRAVV